MQRSHFVCDTAKRPDIALEVVGFVAPHLWTSIVGRPCLGVVQTILSGNFRDIQVAHFDYVIVGQENICRLNKKGYQIQNL